MSGPERRANAAAFTVDRNGDDDIGEERLLHDALRKGEQRLDAIQQIVGADPESIRRRDDGTGTGTGTGGSLPIHVAVEHGASLTVVRFLVDACPESLQDESPPPAATGHRLAWSDFWRPGSRAPFKKGQARVAAAAPFRRHSGLLAPRRRRIRRRGPAPRGHVCPAALLSKTNDGSAVPLHCAAAAAAPNPSLEVVRILANACPRALTIKDDRRWLPLHCAVAAAAAPSSAAAEVVGLLADMQPEGLLERTDRGWTPLHLATPVWRRGR
jgi:hypothetical protein